MIRDGLEPGHLIVVLAVVLLMFGSKRLPEVARGLGQSLRIFKTEMSATQHDGDADVPRPA